MLEKLTDIREKLTAMQNMYSRDAWKAHSHSGKDAPEMLEKLTAMQDKIPEMLEKRTAVQDRMSQRCLKAYSHAG